MKKIVQLPSRQRISEPSWWPASIHRLDDHPRRRLGDAMTPAWSLGISLVILALGYFVVGTWLVYWWL